MKRRRDGEADEPENPFAGDDVEEPGTADRDDSGRGRSGLPWIYAREGVQDGRTKTVQLHLQRDSADRDRQERARLQQRTSENLVKADFREAVFLAGLANMDQAIDHLEEWGYDFE